MKTIYFLIFLIQASFLNAALIDDFSVGGHPVQYNSTVYGTNIIGGARTVLRPDFNSEGKDPQITFEIENGQFTFINETSSPVGTTFIWDNAGLGLAPTDLTDSGSSNGFLIEVLEGQEYEIDYGITLEDINGESASLIKWAEDYSPNKYTPLFNEFTYQSFDFTQVTSVRIIFHMWDGGWEDPTLIIDSIETGDLGAVPEPSSFSFIVLSFLFIGFIRKKLVLS